jgi:hypothetical protein
MEHDYARMAARLEGFILCVGMAGIPAAFYFWGWRGAIGFVLGAAVAWLNFRRLRAVVDVLGGQRGRASWMGTAAMYFGVGMAGYVMIKYFEVSVLSAFGGLLFVPVGAVLLEVLYTFIYGT